MSQRSKVSTVICTPISTSPTPGPLARCFELTRVFRNLARTFIVCFALLFITNTAICQSSEDQLAAHFHAGQQAMQQAQFAKAAEQFKKALALDPTLVEAEVNLGLAYHSLAEYDLAVRHLSKALRTRPNLLAANVIAGADYLKVGAAEKAIPYLQQALKLDPSNREARQALASSYLSQEDFRDAAKEFQEMAENDEDRPEAWFKLGHEYLDLSARLAYRGAHLYPESAWATVLLPIFFFNGAVGMSRRRSIRRHWRSSRNSQVCTFRLVTRCCMAASWRNRNQSSALSCNWASQESRRCLG